MVKLPVKLVKDSVVACGASDMTHVTMTMTMRLPLFPLMNLLSAAAATVVAVAAVAAATLCAHMTDKISDTLAPHGYFQSLAGAACGLSLGLIDCIHLAAVSIGELRRAEPRGNQAETRQSP